ncbi:TPA: hypothetical protein ACPJ0Y_003826 [Vibrio diabolicus]
MKEFLDAILSRMRSPFLGISSLMYLVANVPMIAKFFIVSPDKKLSMLESYHFDYTLLLQCMALALLYIVMADWLQVLIDKLVINAREKRKAITYRSQAKILALEYKSTKAYQEKLVDKELEGWEQERSMLKHSIAEKKEEIALYERNSEDLNEKILQLKNEIAEREKKYLAQKENSISRQNAVMDVLMNIKSIEELLGVRISSDGKKYVGMLESYNTSKKATDDLTTYLNETISKIENDLLGKEDNFDESDTNNVEQIRKL